MFPFIIIVIIVMVDDVSVLVSWKRAAEMSLSFVIRSGVEVREG